MLKERMFVDAPRPPSRYSMSGGLPSPDHALEAMGPVLESVLGSLTQEYEKRLLLKDHELSDARDKNTSLQKQVYSLQVRDSVVQAARYKSHLTIRCRPSQYLRACAP
jgi:hypothetical protein